MTGNVFFGLLPLAVKWALGLGYTGTQITFARFLFSCLGVMALALLGWQKLRSNQWRPLLLRGIFGGLAVLGYFLSLEYTTASKASLLSYTSTLWMNVHNVWIYKRSPSKGFWPLLGAAGLGLWLIIHPTMSGWNKGDIIGLVSGVCGGFALMMVKESRRTDNALSIFGSFSVFGLLFSGMLLLPWSPLPGPAIGLMAPAYPGWLALLVMAALSMAGQLCLTQSYGYMKVTVAGMLALMAPVLAVFFSWIILGEKLNSDFILGSLLILIPCYLLVRAEKVKNISI